MNLINLMTRGARGSRFNYLTSYPALNDNGGTVVPACSGVRFGGDLAGGRALGLALCLCACGPLNCCWRRRQQ
jgi:hypothetical protein